MSIKCSVLGHRYGRTEVEREREEEGSEVILTVREVKRCERCGEERIVSENKEVTTLETAAEIVADDLADEPTADTNESQPRSESTEPAEQADTSAQTATTTPTAEADIDEAGVSKSTGQEPTDDVIEAGDDDAVILDDDEDENEREHGEWPEETETGENAVQASSDEWPEEDATETAEWPEEDNSAEWPNESEDESTGKHREPGEWPEEPEENEDSEKWESLTKPEPRPLDEPAVEPTKSAVSVPDGIFRCSNCEYSTPVEESPLRAGDFCPECRVGALEHHTE